MILLLNMIKPELISYLSSTQPQAITSLSVTTTLHIQNTLPSNGITAQYLVMETYIYLQMASLHNIL